MNAATKAARARHAEGEKRIRALFFPLIRKDGSIELDESRMRFIFRRAEMNRLVALPWRSRLNTPPVRTAEQKARKKRRTAVKASRRRNRR